MYTFAQQICYDLFYLNTVVRYNEWLGAERTLSDPTQIYSQRQTTLGLIVIAILMTPTRVLYLYRTLYILSQRVWDNCIYNKGVEKALWNI